MYAISGSLQRLPRLSLAMTPSVSEGELRISFDGRIDDRNELISALSLSWQSTDPGIIAAAYRQWGADFLSRLSGDFVLALWDGDRQELLLARDCFGTAPLYYHRSLHGVSWSSRLGPLVAETGCDRRPDPHFVSGFLSFGRRGDVSPYAAIAAVPPAGFVRLTRNQEITAKHWRLDPEREIRRRSDAEYEDEFFALFQRSVRNRLRASAPVFCELSGGVDSSSVVAVADAICRAERRSDESLQTVSYIYGEVASFDDRPYIAIARKAFGRRSHDIHERESPLLSSMTEDYPFDEPSPAWMGTAILSAMKKKMAAAGSSVLLSGAGGDDLCWSEIDYPPQIADAVKRFRFGRAVRESRLWAEVLRKPRSLLLKNAVATIFGSVDAKLMPWIDRRFARLTNMHRPWSDMEEARAIRLPSRKLHFLSLHSLAVEMGAMRIVCPEIDLRYPFADRSLVEFVFSIPIEQHLRLNEMRSLQRRAMARVLPRELAYRTTKGSPGGTVYRRFREQWPAIKSIFAAPRVCDYGYADHKALAASLQRAAHGQNVNAPGLLRLLALEMWLRTLERPLAAADPRDQKDEFANGRR
jgi:asparagine synthase (glutamine-hydrolysing)